jgi:hypothetical protein
MVKAYSIPERYINYVKEQAKKFDIAESDMLRRLLDKQMEQDKKEEKQV